MDFLKNLANAKFSYQLGKLNWKITSQPKELSGIALTTHETSHIMEQGEYETQCPFFTAIRQKR